MKIRSKTACLFAAAGAVFLCGALPHVYRIYTTQKLAAKLDNKHGQDGWVATWIAADGQYGEQINLYRTLYVSLLYPKLIGLTPYKKLRFTHKCGYAHMPPHYAVHVFDEKNVSSYRWSMKHNDWYIAYGCEYAPAYTHAPPEMKEPILSMWDMERIQGLNRPRQSEFYPPYTQ